VNLVQNTAYQEAAALEARFRMAARHSRLVRVLRIVVPAAVLFAMAVIVGFSVFNPFRMLMPNLPIDPGNLVVSGTKITMESLHVPGYTSDRRPYELWATTAVQDLTDPDHVELNKLKTRVLMEDGSTAWLDARTGKFDNKQQTLDLHKDIVMKTTNGYEARLSQAFVDLGKNTVTSEEHVDVKMSSGTVSSDRLRIYGGGEVVRFEGNVVMNLDHLDTGDGSTQQADAAPAEPAAPAPKTTRGSKSSNAAGAK
jgi:lipopolysaccharide export system protein LptC